MLIALRFVTIWLTLLCCVSCSIQKRHHVSGYHIEWFGKSNSTAGTQHRIKISGSESKLQEADITTQPLLEASIGVMPLTQPSHRNQMPEKTSAINGCDTIFFIDGVVMKSKVIEIRPEHVVYRYCDNPNGELVTVEKSKIKIIAYANGSSQTFNGTRQTNQTPVTNHTTFSQNDTSRCDTIFYRNGLVVKAKILEITPGKITYRYCDAPHGEAMTVDKADIRVVYHGNGRHETFSRNSAFPWDERQRRVVPAAAHLSLGFGLGGIVLTIYLVGPLFGLVGVISGLVALVQIGSNPERYKGWGYAAAGIATGLLSMALIVLFILVTL